MQKLTISLITVLIFGAVSSWAIPSALDIDFRSGNWSGANGVHSYAVSGATATAFQQSLNGPRPALLSYSATAGLGIDSTILLEDPHEVGPFEFLEVSFAAPAKLRGVWLTTLFREIFRDTGFVDLTLSDGSFASFSFAGQQTARQNPLGDVYVDLGGLEVSKAEFFADDGVLRNRDYSVAGFVVPDGGTTMTLLGCSTLIIVALRRIGLVASEFCCSWNRIEPSNPVGIRKEPAGF